MDLLTEGEEIKRYHELGLGRGIDVTDPEMWKNKSSMLVREVSDNIIVTNECGRKEAYTRSVSSVDMQQQQIQLSLDDPSSRFKIGMDAQHSQSTRTSKIVSGTKWETQAISFKSDFHDVPLYASLSDLSLDVPESSHYAFEEDLCSWILKRIQLLHKKKDSSDDSNDHEASHSRPVEDLVVILKLLISAEVSFGDDKEWDERKNIACISLFLRDSCKEFLTNLGVTHYVSAIKLGAMKYRAVTVKSNRKTFGAEAEVGIGSTATGTVSERVMRGLFRQEEQERHIGKIGDDDTVEEEAVIAFQIQPIDTLVRVQFIQVALRQAIKEYVQSKTDKCQGPFLVSCKVNDCPVYWMVNKNFQVMGTASIKAASLFYVRPAGDPSHPSDFFITYYGEGEYDRISLTNLSDRSVKLREQEIPLPRYLMSDTSFLGNSDKPLELKMAAKTAQAQFSLYSRVQSSFACLMCRTTNVDLCSWLEGEQFYICCCQHSLKLDSFIAMVKIEPTGTKTAGPQTETQIEYEIEPETKPAEAESSETKTAEAESSQTKTAEGKSLETGTAETETVETSEAEYQTVSVLTIKDPSNTEFGMLFRLHPREYKDRYNPKPENISEPSTFEQQHAHLSTLFKYVNSTLTNEQASETTRTVQNLVPLEEDPAPPEPPKPPKPPKPASESMSHLWGSLSSLSAVPRVHFKPVGNASREAVRRYFS